MIVAKDFFVLRTPLFPVNAGEDPSIFKTNSLAREALYLASKTVSDELNEPVQSESLSLTLRKYLKRMTYRSTPFGLFAGISVGTIGNQSKISLAPVNEYRRVTKFDTEVLHDLVTRLVNSYGLRKQLSYQANNSIYHSDENTIRYIEETQSNGSKRYQISSVEKNEYVSKVLTAAGGMTKFAQLASILVSDDISLEEAEDFIDQLIDSSLLRSELEINVTGGNYFDEVLKVIKELHVSDELENFLAELQSQLSTLDHDFNSNDLSAYEKIGDLIRQKVDLDFAGDTRFFHTDLYKPIESCVLNRSVLGDIRKAIEILHALFPFSSGDQLDEFAKNFQRKFGDRELPLLAVIDSESGLGYPIDERRESDKSTLTDDIVPNAAAREASPEMTPLNKFLWNNYMLSFVNGDPINLDIDDLKPFFSAYKKELPNSLFSFGSLIAKDPADIDNSNYLFDLEFTAGPSIANVLSRFCSLDDNLLRKVEDLLREEERINKDVVLAEVIHVPESRAANILARPRLRDYEIAILSRSSADDDRTIRLEDLSITVEDGQVMLWSSKFDKPIVPRLSSAHNFRGNALPVYQFLCDLQFQGIQNTVRWDWGALEQLQFLPRVTLGRVIVSKARWSFDKAALKPYMTKGADQATRLVGFLRSKNVPARISLLTNADMKLLLDLNDVADVKIIIHYMGLNNKITLIEDLFEEGIFVEGPEGRYTNEMIIPWSFVPERQTAPIQKRSIHPGSKFPAGSEWLYVKIYCGVKTGEEILLDRIYPMFETMTEEGIISQWFFIRYADPDFHLRIRVKGTGVFYAEVIRQLHVVLKNEMASEKIWNLQIETYQREVKRYDEYIDFSERVFFFDSRAVAKCLLEFRGDQRDEWRWQIALLGVDSLLNAFGFTDEMKVSLLKNVSESFLKEFNLLDQGGKEQLKKKYRQFRNIVFDLLSPGYSGLEQVRRILDDRNASVVQLIHESNFDLNSVRRNQTENFIHLFLNRVFRSKPRFQEAIAYDILYQHYKSVAAIKKASLNSVSR